MKINLERNFYPRPSQFRCAICEEYCPTNAIRPLLCHDNNQIVGDICTDCRKQPIELTQARLRRRAAQLIAQPHAAWQDRTLSSRKFAAELNDLSYQDIDKPPFYDWCWKWLTIAIAQTRELELARMGKSCLRRSKPLKITFLAEEPSIERLD